MKYLLLILAFLIGCDSGSGDKKTTQKVRVGFANATFRDPWRRALNEQIDQAAEKHKDKIVLEKQDGKDDDKIQSDQIETFIQTGVKVLIVSPNTAGPLTKAVGKAYDSGIITIVIDRNITNDKYHTFIGASNIEIGREAGKYIAEQLKGKGLVVEIQGTKGATATTDRHDGFEQAIKEYKDIKVIASLHADYKRADAMKVMADFLSSHKQIDCVYAHNDEMVIGAYKEAEAKQRQKGTIFVGIDGQQDCIDMIKEGKIHATFEYPRPGAAAIDAAIKLLKGESVPKTIVLETLKITKENADKIKGY